MGDSSISSGGQAITRWTRWTLRYRTVLLVCWFAVTVLGAISAIRLPALLSTSLAVPGSGSDRANRILAQHFGENPEGTFTIVFRVPRGSTVDTRALREQVGTAAHGVPGAHPGPLQRAPGIIYISVETALDLQEAARYTTTLRAALNRQQGPTAYVTGEPALQHDLDPVLQADLVRGESIVVPIALVILAAVLGVRGILLLPILFAGSTIMGALAIVYVLAHLFPMISYIPNMVELVGLGLSIDYSILFAHRFREEVGAGRSVEQALERTMASAGRTVIWSGMAVAIGLSAVLLMPVPAIRSLGLAGVIVPIVAIAAALTVQPALLSFLGWGGVVRGWPRVTGRTEAGRWAHLARIVVRRPALLLVASAVIMGALAAPAIRLQLTSGSLSTVPQSSPSAQGLAAIRNAVGPGAITPLQIVADTGEKGRARSGAMDAAVLRLAEKLLPDSEVFVVEIGSKWPYIDRTGRYRRVIARPRHAFGEVATERLVTRVRTRFIPAARFPPGVTVWAGGAPAQGADFLDRVYGAFGWIVLVVLLLAYVVLLRTFRSLLLPLFAMLLDLLSVGAAYGILVILFRFGVGTVLGLQRAPQVEGWIPVLLFATLFGLSMDYQVFLVSRMREAREIGMDGTAAVAYGLERTGRIVSAAAAIMVVSFSGFMMGRVPGLQEFGAGLAFGVLLDATVVRMLLLPSVMVLLGGWIWWLPPLPARLARVEASPLARRESGGLDVDV